jgi:hypothetical protein
MKQIESTKAAITHESMPVLNNVLGEVLFYSIEQFPKNKDITNLSNEQKKIRINQKKYEYDNEITCVKCFRSQPIKEFYIKDKYTGRRSSCCRDCKMKFAGVVEIGKLRFSEEILKKGFRRCSICKDIKPLTSYKKNKNQYKGISNNCYDCQKELSKDYVQRQSKNIGDFHIKQYAKRRNHNEFNQEIVNKLREEIIEKRKSKYFVDGKEFVTVKDFAKYIKGQYGFPTTMTEKRIARGKTEEECKISEPEMRSIGHTKGSILVTDTVTKDVFIFKNTSDEGLKKMFSTSVITRCIKTGEKTTITSMSKYKNPCTIIRV